jgi:hypothetical protein
VYLAALSEKAEVTDPQLGINYPWYLYANIPDNNESSELKTSLEQR